MFLALEDLLEVLGEEEVVGDEGHEVGEVHAHEEETEDEVEQDPLGLLQLPQVDVQETPGPEEGDVEGHEGHGHGHQHHGQL